MRIKGGLGNQLFQYAAGYSAAKRLNTELVLDTTFFPTQTLRGYKLGKLKTDFRETFSLGTTHNLLKNKYINKLLRKLNIQRITIGKDSCFLLETRSEIMNRFFSEKAKDIYFDGYYQSELYFNEYRTDLLRQFTPSYSEEAEYTTAKKMIDSELSVAVHVRRGDFLKAQNDFNSNHYLLGINYYHNALQYMKSILPENAVYFWFSDDIEWVKSSFGELKNYRYINLKTENADIDEMMLMKQCKHIIAANSTFSWWAAWMNERNDAIRTVPDKRFGNLHMIPDGWIKIPVE